MTLDELRALAAKHRKKRESYKHRICVCTAAGCLSAGGAEVKESFEKAVKDRDLGSCCQVQGVGCMGLCSAGPLVYHETSETMYQKLKPEDAVRVIENLENPPLQDLRCDLEMPFFKKQTRVVLENCWIINPESLEDYLSVGGYEALYDVLNNWEPNQVIEEMTKSGLRGRGGGGYPAGLKWSTVAKASGTEKYVVCNADEGDPGAFMDRSILESDPHRVLEGMAIAAYAIGANHGYVYVRAEYPLAIERLQLAVKQARKQDLLGRNIMGSTFNLEIEIRYGAGAFVCGEETALLASIEGSRGTPRPRPPYPAEKGVWGKPTLINNVETFANVTPILRNGADWYSSIGTETSKGTKVFAIAGQIVNTGLIEVPMGTSMKEIVEEIGGGAPQGKSIKAVQTGGPSGGCIPREKLDVPMDFESLKLLGSMMGSGGMIVIDDKADMVDVARYFMDFCVTESCGKCIPCRAGTSQMLALLEKIIRKEANRGDLELLEELCEMVRETSLCGLGQTAPNPVLSTLRFFRDEYDALIACNSNGANSAPKPVSVGSTDSQPSVEKEKSE